MTLYEKAWLFVGGGLLLLLTSPFWLWGLLGERFGGAGMVAGVALFIACGLSGQLLFKCRACSRYPFVTRQAGLQWAGFPRKTCGRCGASTDVA